MENSKKSIVVKAKVRISISRKQEKTSNILSLKRFLLFIQNRPEQRLKNRFGWFKKWILESNI